MELRITREPNEGLSKKSIEYMTPESMEYDAFRGFCMFRVTIFIFAGNLGKMELWCTMFSCALRGKRADRMKT